MDVDMSYSDYDFDVLRKIYRNEGIIQLTSALILKTENAADFIASIADDAIAFATLKNDTGKNYYETVKVIRDKLIIERQVLTRIENFISPVTSKDWYMLSSTNGPISKFIGHILYNDGDDDEIDRDWCLYKEKLNIKPAGGSGYAAHVDTPSLKVTGLSENIVTVMIAIDDMTEENGCLQVARNQYRKNSPIPCENGDILTGDPDGNGRQGAINTNDASNMHWEAIEAKSGDIWLFSGWLPHKSVANKSQHARRALFLTYNHPEDGDLRDIYYQIMREKRQAYLNLSVSMQKQ